MINCDQGSCHIPGRPRIHGERFPILAVSIPYVSAIASAPKRSRVNPGHGGAFDAIVNPGSLLSPASVPAPARQAGSSQSLAFTAGKVCFGSNVTAVICASAFSSASQWSWSSRIRSVGSFHVLHDGTGVARMTRCPLFRAFSLPVDIGGRHRQMVAMDSDPSRCCPKRCPVVLNCIKALNCLIISHYFTEFCRLSSVGRAPDL